MLDFYQKRKLRTICNSRITQGLLAVVAFIMLWNAFERYTIADAMGDRRALVEQEAATLEARKASLEAEVEYLRDERGIESAMRRQFDIALPGEEVVVILEDETKVEFEPLATTTATESGWWPW
jgi:cell division protein FtsB